MGIPFIFRFSLLSDFYFFTVLIDRDVCDFGFGDPDACAVTVEAFGFDDDLDRDRRSADADGFGVKADEIADKDRFVKDDFLHSHRHETVVIGGAHRADTARNVDITQNHAAEDRAVCVRITRHHRQANRRISQLFCLFVFHSSIVSQKAKILFRAASPDLHEASLNLCEATANLCDDIAYLQIDNLTFQR